MRMTRLRRREEVAKVDDEVLNLCKGFVTSVNVQS